MQSWTAVIVYVLNQFFDLEIKIIINVFSINFTLILKVSFVE